MKPLICLVILIGSNWPIKAHEFLTDILVYPETIGTDPYSTLNVVETFHLTANDLFKAAGKDLIKQEIKRIVARRSEDVPEAAIVCDDWDAVFKTCGVFDHWNLARSIAIDLCAGVAVGYPSLYPDGLIPQFLGPATFINDVAISEEHHTAYQFDAGLSFNCVEVVSSMTVD